ncbi:MAG: phosphoesterase PA-phosphatase, partial [Sphaerochaetaceae bacterium]|nr:phosphoesterase PA-phosphatase [Sphaerochaetaceae bacterium]
MKRNILLALFLLLMFFTLVLALATVDVRPIGPQQSFIGLATINKAFHQFIGVHLQWYEITDWLGLAALAVAL